jgi:hypothetical protein
VSLPCPVCGVDEARITVDDAGGALRTFPRRYREALEGVDGVTLARRPDTTTWSMLEYAVHVREVLELLAMTLPLVLEQAEPVFPAIDVDDATMHRPDWVMDPGLALDGITQACGTFVERIDATPYAAWDRSFAIGDTRHAARWLPQHAAHEGAHHLRDIERVRQLVAAPAADD